jgi:hypothetical protein
VKHAQVDGLPMDEPAAQRPSDEMTPMDDLTVGLARARRTPWLTRSTGVMLGLVLICAGFLAGLQVQKSYGTAGGATTGLPADLQQRMQQRGSGGFGGPGGGQGATTGDGQPTAAATPTTGKIKLVDGTTVYIETADGRTITVKTAETTIVQSAAPAQLKDLAVGASVTVLGATSGTTMSATSITAGP